MDYTTALDRVLATAKYCRVDNAAGFVKKYPKETVLHRGMIGTIRHQSTWATTKSRFSIDTGYPPPGHERPSKTVHKWVWPIDGDTITFFAADLKELGVWDGITMRYIPAPDPIKYQNITSKEFLREGASMFTPTTVKAKGGYRAQVQYQGSVVWESTTVHADDENYVQADYDDGVRGKGQSGQDKAHTVAVNAVNTVVEDLFSKIKG
jgi:hypothetical protein